MTSNSVYAEHTAVQSAWMHAHPILLAVLPLFAALLIITIFVLVRWLLSRGAWPYHPGGSKGFLRDEAVRYASIWLPFAIVMVVVRYYIYAFHPEYMDSPYLPALYLSVFLFRRLSGLLPHVKEIGARIDAARRAARDAKDGVKA